MILVHGRGSSGDDMADLANALAAAVFARSKAAVTRQIYSGVAHTVFPGELEWLRDRISELAVRV